MKIQPDELILFMKLNASLNGRSRTEPIYWPDRMWKPYERWCKKHSLNPLTYLNEHKRA